MLGFLRFVGVLNAAVWLGAAVFFTFGADPAAFSPEMKELLGPKNYPFFSGAIAQVMAGRYFYFQYACALLAFLHLLAEWLYFGKNPRRFWLGLLVGLAVLSLVGGCWFQPKLKRLHRLQYTRPATREMVSRSFSTWHAVAEIGNLLTVAGLAIYLWRVANPPDPTRFVSAAKFRS